ncbi:MAG: radical SAM family heme chaperone HemW [Terrisporobacter sp.]|uniref:radical SAM family heme chaperone HemW n=1 Tax=Terrisporobacter sp. TaxID=1965305 RepID=UPI002FCB72AC
MLGLYVHIPFCVKKCKYCDFNSFKLNIDEKKKYLQGLEKEMKFYKNEATDKEIDSIFIGGGTPSVLNEEEVRSLFEKINNNFKISKNAEITMECNPGTINLSKLIAMRESGVNRLSIGLQAVQNHHLKYIGRIHTYEEFEKNYMQARGVGFDNINIDLMYALPNQSEKDWKETLEKVVKLNPEHISAYSLILEENTELFDMYNKGEFNLLDEDTDIEMYEYTIKYLKANGYNQYEISNYAKSGYECNHNILYWKCENYIGLGASASGYLGDIRYNNICDLEKYETVVFDNKKPVESEEILKDEDKIEENVFLGLRMNEGIHFKYFEQKYNTNFKEKYKEQLEKLEKMNLIKVDDEGMALTQKGREISNTVFIEFLK